MILSPQRRYVDIIRSWGIFYDFLGGLAKKDIRALNALSLGTSLVLQSEKSFCGILSAIAAMRAEV